MRIHIVKSKFDYGKCFSSENLRVNLLEFFTKVFKDSAYNEKDEYTVCTNPNDAVNTLLAQGRVMLYNHPKYGNDTYELLTYNVD